MSETKNETAGKKLMVNTALCDMTKTSEATLMAYDRIEVNAATVIISDETQRLIAEYPVTINCASTVNVPAGCIPVIQNGKIEIRPGQKPAEKAVLIVNGKLIVHEGSEEALASYAAIIINGKALCPESLASVMAKAQVNGSIEYYPDGAIMLDSTFAPDRVFLMRAREGDLYYNRQLLLLDPALDLSPLLEKHTAFSCKKALVCESRLEQAVQLLPRECEIIPLPDGCAYVDDDAELNRPLLRQHGTSLYIDGNLLIPKDAKDLLEEITYLAVGGDIRIPEELLELLLTKCRIYRGVKSMRGKEIADKASLKVDRAMLESCEEGIFIRDCAIVKFKPDIPVELIRQRLISIEDCAIIRCTEEQQSAIELVAKDCAKIGSGGRGEDFGFMDAIKGAMGHGDDGTKVINSAQYTL